MFWCERTTGFCTGGYVIMDYGILYIGDNLKLKQLNDGFVCFLQTHRFSIHKMLIDGLESCGLLWCFYPLQRIHWWASDAMLHFSKSVTMKKQTHRHVGFSANSNFEDKYVKIKAHTHLTVRFNVPMLRLLELSKTSLQQARFTLLHHCKTKKDGGKRHTEEGNVRYTKCKLAYN